MSVLLHYQELNVYTPRHQYTLSNVRTTPSPRIKRKNISASVYFIECPYCSITKANKPKNIVASNTISFGKTNKRYPSLNVDKIRGLRAVQWTNKVDKEVSTQIYYYNDHLKLLNRGISTPRLYQYIILSNKSNCEI